MITMIEGHKLLKVIRFLSSGLVFILPVCYPHIAAPAETTFTDVAPLLGVADMGRGRGSAFFDCNGDGHLDIFVANAGDPNTFYCHLKRKEIFRDMTAAAKLVGEEGNREGYGVAIGDYDNDGDLDIYIANGGLTYEPSAQNLLYRNDLLTTGTFTEVASAAGVAYRGPSFSAAWGDYDNDGHLDLYVANVGKSNVLYRNNGDGTFTDMTARAGVGDIGWGISTLFADYDNDGDLDIFVANRSTPNVLYRNNGDGAFTDVAKAAGVQKPLWAFTAAFGDYDNDGDLDIYVPNGQAGPGQGEPDRLYRNNGNENHWLIVKTIGTKSNRDGIGAKVTVFVGSELRYAEVSGGCGFGVTNSLPVEFELGRYTRVDRLKVAWPSGIIQEFGDLSADRKVRIIEGENQLLFSSQ